MRPPLLSIPEPNYPYTAQEGRVAIWVLVKAQRGVEGADVVQRSGFESFDSVEIESVLAARFPLGSRAGIFSCLRKPNRYNV